MPLGISKPEVKEDEKAKTIQKKQMSQEEGKGNNEGHYPTEARVPGRELLRVQLQQEFQEISFLDCGKSDCQVYHTGMPGEKGDSLFRKCTSEKTEKIREGKRFWQSFILFSKKRKMGKFCQDLRLRSRSVLLISVRIQEAQLIPIAVRILDPRKF